MPNSYSCRDCPPGEVITDHAYRVQRRNKHRDEDGRLVAVDLLDEYDIYCKTHYQEREHADTL